MRVYYHITGDRWLTDLKLRELYNRSRIVLCLARNEPFGLIPLEAAACGVPVVALDSGGYRETVNDGKTGYLVKNTKDLTEKIELILSSERLRVSLGAGARKNAQSNWTWDKSTKKSRRYSVKRKRSR